jgi:hypothetical protein
MPVTITNVDYLFTDIGGIFQYLRNSFITYLGDINQNTATYTFSNTTRYGFYSFKIARLHSGGTQETDTYLSLITLPAGSKIGIRQMVASPGWQGSTIINGASIPGAAMTTAAIDAGWALYVYENMESIALSCGAAGLQQAHENDSTSFNNWLFQAEVSIQFQGSLEIVNLAETLYVFSFSGTTGQTIAGVNATQAQESGVGAQSQDLSDVVAALNALAFRNYTLNLNNGQTIFSVDGSITS